MMRLAAEEPWKARLEGRWQAHAVEPLAWYAETLLRLGWEVEAWETTYLHLLPGENPVIEWMKGTALRPILKVLGPEGAAFLDALAPRFRAAYPPGPDGTLFPFRRLFFVAVRK
jgi:trans-aconitate 2-methyltransferase